MSSTQVRIDKELYHKLQVHAYNKHKNFRCLKKEVDEAVKEYLAKQQDLEKEG